MRDLDEIDDTRILTKAELIIEADEEWNSMSEDEKHFRITNGDPTFLQYVLSCFSKAEDADKIEISEFNKTYKLIEK